MSARREVTVFCNQCFCSFSVVNTRSIRFGRSQAAYMGWVYDGVNDFCSQVHREEFYRRQNIHLVSNEKPWTSSYRKRGGYAAGGEVRPLPKVPSGPAPGAGVLVIRTNGLPEGYVPPSASLRGQDMLDRTPAPPKPEGRTGPVIVSDVND